MLPSVTSTNREPAEQEITRNSTLRNKKNGVQALSQLRILFPGRVPEPISRREKTQKLLTLFHSH
jgi:hypothetical protein